MQQVEVDVAVAHRAVQGDRHRDQAEAERTRPQRARHQTAARLASSALREVPLGRGLTALRRLDRLAFGLLLDHRQHRVAIGVAHSSRARTWHRVGRAATRAVSSSSLLGCLPGAAISSSSSGTSSSTKRIVCRTITSCTARIATRWALLWNTKRPIPDPPRALQRGVQQQVGLARPACPGRGSRRARSRPGRSARGRRSARSRPHAPGALGGGDLLLGEHHIGAFADLVALDDLAVGNLAALLRAQSLVLDRGAVLRVALAQGNPPSTRWPSTA